MELGATVNKSDRLCGLAWNSTRLHEKSNATLPAIHNSNNDDDDDNDEVDSGGRNNGEMFFPCLLTQLFPYSDNPEERIDLLHFTIEKLFFQC